MKKSIFFAVTVAALLAFAGCSSDSEPELPEPSKPGIEVVPDDESGSQGGEDNPSGGTDNPPESITIVNGGMADLGLPSGTKWAACNVGADAPQKFGGYYSWGEIDPREGEERTYRNYKWYNYGDSGYGMVKYNVDPESGTLDGRFILLPEDDVATVALGAGWRMPTEEEMRELVLECKWSRYQIDSVEGYAITGKNGTSIFMPLAGYIELNSSEPRQVGQSVWFWTCESARSTQYPDRAYAYNSGGDYLEFLTKHPIYYRACGMSVRAVQAPSIEEPAIVRDFTNKGEISVSAVSAELRSFILSTSSNIESYGFCYSQTNREPTISDPYLEGRIVKGNHVYTRLTGLEPSKQYHCRAYIKIAGKVYYEDGTRLIETKSASSLIGTGELVKSTASSAKVGATFNSKDVLYNSIKFGVCYSESANPDVNSNFVEIPIKENTSTYKAELTGLSEGKTYHYRAVLQIDGQVIYGEDKNFVAGQGGEVLKAVDMGLPSGTKWANMNVGAETQSEAGSYFAWGEIAPKESYTYDGYKWYDSKNKYIKYCYYDRDYSPTYWDDKYVLDNADDAALRNTNGAFRTPTPTEISELLSGDYTTLKVDTLSGVKGVRVTSKANGNSIFLPVSGYYEDSALKYGDKYVVFMSNTRPQKYSGPISVCYITTIDVSKDPIGKKTGNETRSYGYPVRGVAAQ